MASPTLDDEVRVPERVEFSRVRDQIALLNVETGVYFGLDEIGARMWDLLCEHRTLRAAAERMDSEFAVEPARLREDLLRLVGELVDKGLLEIA
jgi:hypothetical protein